MKRPTTMEQYRDLVTQTLLEVEDLRLAAEYDMDSMGEAAGFIGHLDHQLRALKAALDSGSYQFKDEDLPYMALIARVDPLLLPFKALLRLINETHRQGLDSAG
jgi:hypothetical protein